MRFKLIDKFVLVLLLLLTLALSAMFLALAMNFIPDGIIEKAGRIAVNGVLVNRLIFAAIGLVLLVFALQLFIAMCRRELSPRDKAPTSTLLSAGENGAAYISLSAVDALVQRHCRANQRIKECESTVIPMQSGVSVSLRLQVLPDTVIPELAAQLQQSLKEYIETISGITVTGVDILILPLAQPKAPKTM
ncbi:MAG: hypothetical protein BWY35_01442 [Firmicutes bacterium ADurb.Bin248]|nr:MAG: hypothetical protein BWY35_01442 [Firmicutes bacterium ADurb.Bin248]HOG00364.1 alkaline shock response membrane anchor protein AmaP [Clostridia bacterium]HPK15602.1 alkaline shock response membrane anchor protein AmaP [Clostridia bacterium]